MTSIKQMREELSSAHKDGYEKEVRKRSGIKGNPQDALETVLLWLALRAAKGEAYAPAACEWLKKFMKG